MYIRIVQVILIIFIIGLGLYTFFIQDVEVEETTYEQVVEISPIVIPSDPEFAEGESRDFSTRPVDSLEMTDEFNLAIPFTPQAPHANWDLPYQEACEEASVYMTWLYFEGYDSGLVDPGVADTAILELVAFQNDYLGDYLDTTAEETVSFIDAFYDLNAYVVRDPTVDQIKNQIFNGYPVMVPAAGRELGNPFFSGDGPLYHMLVIRGYTENQFIVNDPGTRRGQEYVYDVDVIMNAMGDWNDGDPANGDKVVIFVEPIN